MKHVNIITAVGFLAGATLFNASLSAQPAEVRIVVTPEPGSAIYTDFTHGLDLATPVGSTLRFTCQYRSEQVTSAVVMPWILYSPDNSISTGTRIENTTLVGKWTTVDVWFFGGQLRTELIDGVLPDQMATAGIAYRFLLPVNSCSLMRLRDYPHHQRRM